MTMKVVIQNTDQTRKLRVVTRDKQGDVMLPSAGPENIVEPQGSTEVWIHAGRDVVLEEV